MCSPNRLFSLGSEVFPLSEERNHPITGESITLGSRVISAYLVPSISTLKMVCVFAMQLTQSFTSERVDRRAAEQSRLPELQADYWLIKSKKGKNTNSHLPSTRLHLWGLTTLFNVFLKN